MSTQALHPYDSTAAHQIIGYAKMLQYLLIRGREVSITVMLSAAAAVAVGAPVGEASRTRASVYMSAARAWLIPHYSLERTNVADSSVTQLVLDTPRHVSIPHSGSVVVCQPTRNTHLVSYLPTSSPTRRVHHRPRPPHTSSSPSALQLDGPPITLDIVFLLAIPSARPAWFHPSRSLPGMHRQEVWDIA